MTLELYDTRTRRKRPFEPLEPGRVRIYTCGPTVYAPQHLGNLRSQLVADLLKRVLRLEGYEVIHVVNITDVGHLTDDADAGEDKMEAAARKSGRRAEEIAREYTELWLRDRALVGCLPPEVLCRATEHIEQQIALIRSLEEKGFTYRIEDGIYFDTSRFPRYGEFAGLDIEGQAGGHRIGDVPGKRHPADFALWKFAPPGVRRQQEWDSPWGRGFPGWHIECSAMSMHYLGVPFDIHTGGVDHIQVHHTNETAQSECATGVHPWVRTWIHCEWLIFGSEKMAKSKGNVRLLQDLIDAGIEPRAFRFFFLQAHYRQQQTYTDEAMEAAWRGYRRLREQTAALAGEGGKPSPERIRPHLERFRAALRDDLNAPRALAALFEALRDPALEAADRRALVEEVDRVLALDLLRPLPESTREEEGDPRIEALLAEREEARKRRDFATADRIRAELEAEGIEVRDTAEGPRWRRR